MIRETAALVRHSLSRMRTTLVVMAVALATFQVLLALAAAELRRAGTFAQLANLVPPAIRELFGTSLVAMMSFSGIMALGYYHVAIVAVLVGLVVAVATEPAAEIEVGIADLVLSRSVPRAAVMTRSVIMLVACPALVILAMAGGTFLGLWIAVPPGAEGPAAALVWSLGFSLWALLACWGGVSLAIGALARRRTVAGSIAGSLAAALMLVDYLSRVWKPLRGLARLSPFRYYNPLALVTGRPFPVSDIALLLGAGALAILVAYVLFLRRDV